MLCLSPIVVTTGPKRVAHFQGVATRLELWFEVFWVDMLPYLKEDVHVT